MVSFNFVDVFFFWKENAFEPAKVGEVRTGSQHLEVFEMHVVFHVLRNIVTYNIDL